MRNDLPLFALYFCPFSYDYRCFPLKKKNHFNCYRLKINKCASLFSSHLQNCKGVQQYCWHVSLNHSAYKVGKIFLPFHGADGGIHCGSQDREMACLIKQVIHFALRCVKWEMVCTHMKKNWRCCFFFKSTTFLKTKLTGWACGFRCEMYGLIVSWDCFRNTQCKSPQSVQL